ncbi:hypothetical protein HELRODRAFT_165748 [Helobdella robusta]|uniref:Uncharacterized protein n=1 Tax=Helobdella robusta TaxID=6412 RepID=T1EX88_HELRO|nr:hypothetical protein HELRODRAFT_165748 [Helobdella robusta]ESN91689.1 hypothetical protein HELRODRAFT_165748 [Helobdella robusta]
MMLSLMFLLLLLFLLLMSLSLIITDVLNLTLSTFLILWSVENDDGDDDEEDSGDNESVDDVDHENDDYMKMMMVYVYFKCDSQIPKFNFHGTFLYTTQFRQFRFYTLNLYYD